MKFWSTYILILLLGLGSCAGSYYFGNTAIQKIFKWETADARVLDYTRTGSKGMSKMAIAFTYKGEEHSFNETINTNDLSKNFRMKVIFPKEDLSRAEIRNYKNILGIPAFLAVLGLILTAIGFFKMKNRIDGVAEPDPSTLKPNPKLQGVRDFLQDNLKKE